MKSKSNSLLCFYKGRSMQRNMCVLVVFLAVVCADYAYAGFVDFNDGGHHTIDHLIEDTVRVDYQTPGIATQLDIVDGALLERPLRAYENSIVKIQGGQTGTIYAKGYCIVDMSGGTIYTLHAEYDSQVTVNDGSISELLWLHGRSNVTFSGGTIGTDITVDAEALLTFVGSNFAIDGTPVGYGDLASNYAFTGTVTGTLANGDILNNDFTITSSFADITFIPEPATLLLLGLGAVIVRSKKGQGKSEKLIREL